MQIGTQQQSVKDIYGWKDAHFVWFADSNGPIESIEIYCTKELLNPYAFLLDANIITHCVLYIHNYSCRKWGVRDEYFLWLISVQKQIQHLKQKTKQQQQH